MTERLETIDSPTALERHLEVARAELRNPTEDVWGRPVLAKIGGGLLRVVEYTFPGATMSHLYAKKFDRSPKGSGPHFDVYDDYLDERFPWVLSYNISGEAKLYATSLDPDLAKVYKQTYPEPTEDAKDARRDYANLAFKNKQRVKYEGELTPTMAMILVQHKRQAHIVHHILPRDSKNPGTFIKVAAANGSGGAVVLEQHGMMPLGYVLDRALGGPDVPVRTDAFDGDAPAEFDGYVVEDLEAKGINSGDETVESLDATRSRLSRILPGIDSSPRYSSDYERSPCNLD